LSSAKKHLGKYPECPKSIGISTTIHIKDIKFDDKNIQLLTTKEIHDIAMEMAKQKSYPYYCRFDPLQKPKHQPFIFR